MGNCWGSFYKGKSTTLGVDHHTTPGTSDNCSAGGKSQFSQAASEAIEEGNPNGQILKTPNLKVFIFADLKTANMNFKPYNLLGEGAFGNVYKSWIDEKTLAPSKSRIGMVVAIKIFNSEGMQGLEEWQVYSTFLAKQS